MALTAEQLKAAGKKRIEVPLPDAGGSAWLRKLSAGDYEWLASEHCIGGQPAPSFSCALLAVTLCDEAGALLFGREQLAGAESIDREIAETLAVASSKLNGFVKDEGATEKKD